MSEHRHRTVERHCDVLVVGGSAAGLAAALQLGRQRRAVIVVDAGEPRNAPAQHLHSYLGHDGLPPTELLAIAREEVRRYGGEVVAGRVTTVEALPEGGFRAELTGGHAVVGRRLLLATGLVDELPAIDGLAELWGTDVIHCPFCHGYEVRDQQIVQIVTHPLGLHQAMLFRQLTAKLTVVIHDDTGIEAAALDTLAAGGVTVIHGTATRMVTESGRLRGVEVAGHGTIAADVAVVGPRFTVRAAPFAGLGIELAAHPSGLGDSVVANQFGATSVAGVYAAGNVVEPNQQLLQAAAAGSFVGGAISGDLATEDLAAAARRSANAADWDQRYSGEQLWSGNPNGTLVAEVATLATGSALDVGAGEGGDAVWLAEQGWTVTASDVSTRALGRVAGEAERRGLAVECLHADANAADPFAGRSFDLVSAQYASIPRSTDDRGVTNLLAAVAPGGTLLVVGHDLAPMRGPIDTHETSRPFDADAYVRVDDFAAVLADDADWEVEHHAKRPRPAGAASSHHVDDVVLRARRLR